MSIALWSGVVVLASAVAFAFGYVSRRIDESRPTKCGNEICRSRSDPRCASGNCTYHCQAMWGCGGRCLDAWKASEKAEQFARDVIQKARAK